MLKRFLKVAMLLCVVTLFLSALSVNTIEAKANSSFGKVFQGHFSPNVGAPTFRFLNSVAAVSASNVWAVGNSSKSNNSSQALIEHWNGTQWSLIKSPNPGSLQNGLGGVAAITANNVWAVGNSSNNSTSSQTLVEHWNGKQWSVVTSPNPAGWAFNALSGIAAVSSSDIWAVGNSSKSNNSSQALIEHWNGKQWSVVTSPNPGSLQNGLGGVAAVMANNVWAVGSFSNNSTSSQTLIERWNGFFWSVVTSPNPPGSTVNTLDGVAVVSTNNIWTVGSSNGFSQTLIEHWNGTKWSIVKSPNPGQIDLLIGIAVVSASNIWAVGQALVGSSWQTLIEHWNGSKWSVVTSPSQPGSTNNFLDGIAVISANDIWAVGGFQSSSNAGYTLIENWDGTKWSIVKSSNT